MPIHSSVHLSSIQISIHPFSHPTFYPNNQHFVYPYS
jgi:hypothetical protein